jgi:flagellar hook-associated protein 1 FlgK
MTLLGALNLGRSSLAAQQTGLQVTGNNIANAGTEGYTRQTVRLTPGGPEQIAPGQFLGTGVNVNSIAREANFAVNESLRNAVSDQSSASTLDNLLGRVEATFGALNDNDLSARMTGFFNSFSQLANNVADQAQRSVVIQNGVSIANYLQSLRSQLSAIRTDAQSQVSALVGQANALVQSIASLNKQIAITEGGAGGANTLYDQRDQALTDLAKIIDIKVVDQGGGNLNVLVGSMPVVTGTTTRGISSKQIAAPAPATYMNTQVTFGDNGDELVVSGGKLGALISARDAYLSPAVQTVDTIAAGLINAVNSIHSQGQGLTGFSTLTGTTAVADATAPLNAAYATTNIAFAPKNGTFNLYLKDTTTGQITTKQIAVNLSGTGPQTTLGSLAASITAAGGGTVTGTIDAGGHLVVSSSNGNVTFGFGEDSSGTLASLGLNTFFTGTDATNIGVNTLLQANPSMLAAGRNNVAGSNANALALSLAGSAAVGQLGGKSLTDYYSNYIGALAAHAKNAADDVTAQNTIYDTLYAQQQAISGVSLDEEAINLTKYQRAFQGTARYITVVDEMMQAVLGLLG